MAMHFALLATLGVLATATRTRTDVLLHETPEVSEGTAAAASKTGRHSAASSSSALESSNANAFLPFRAALGTATLAASGLREQGASPLTTVASLLPSRVDSGPFFMLASASVSGEDRERLALMHVNYGTTTSVTIMPREWADQFQERAVHGISQGAESHIYRARLRCNQDVEIAYMIKNSLDRATKNHADMVEHLGFSGGIVRTFERQVFPKLSFFLTEPIHATLAEVVSEAEANGGRLPLERSMLVLIDLLRAMRDLETAGVVYEEFGLDHVLFVDRDGHERAVIGDLGGVEFAEASKFARRRAAARTSSDLGPAARSRGRAKLDGYGNVMPVGLVFARLIFGYDVLQVSFMQRLSDRSYRPGLGWWRDMLRKDIDVEQLVDFERITDERVRDLLRGMLERNAELRWSALGALHQAESVAREMDIEVPPEVRPPDLPSCWDQRQWQ